MNVIVFDLGGTLMQYEGMPYSWIDYYSIGFKTLNNKYKCNASEMLINKSVEILKSYNPRINYREVEYTPQQIFAEALKKWNIACPLEEMIYSFFEGLQLKSVIYEETIPIIIKLKEYDYKIATLTDLPTAMPDDLFKKDIKELLPYFDLYVSSLSCGFRKPNPQGLNYIAKYFGISINELLFVGDEEKDRKTAENADCKFAKIVRNETLTNKVYTLQNLLKDITTN